jgi:hypothetical protein
MFIKKRIILDILMIILLLPILVALKKYLPLVIAWFYK